MNENDFDPKVIQLAKEYSYAISGGLLKTLWEKEVFNSLDLNTGSKKGIERLFTNV